MDEKVILLASRSEDSRLWTPAQMLEDALADVMSGERPHNKALILFLSDRDGKYDVGFSQANMSMSECIALCEIAKTIFKEQMRF